MTSRSRKAASSAGSTQPSSGVKPKPQRPSSTQPLSKLREPNAQEQTAKSQPSPVRPSFGLLPHLTSPITRWVFCPALAVITITGGTGTYLFRGIQTYRYYDWTILPVSDTRLEAACGELTVYYMSWQDPKTEKPVGHAVNGAERSKCAASKETPTPASRFTGLGNKAVLSQLGCKPEGGLIEKAVAWDCTKPVGKLLKAEIEASSHPKQW